MDKDFPYPKVWGSELKKNISEIRDEYTNCSIQSLGEFITYYNLDERNGVKKIVLAAKKKLEEAGAKAELK